MDFRRESVIRRLVKFFESLKSAFGASFMSRTFQLSSHFSDQITLDEYLFNWTAWHFMGMDEVSALQVTAIVTRGSRQDKK